MVRDATLEFPPLNRFLARRMIERTRTAVTLASGRAALGDNRRVVVILRGAMDGLSVTVPYGDANYVPLRGGLANGIGEQIVHLLREKLFAVRRLRIQKEQRAQRDFEQ